MDKPKFETPDMTQKNIDKIAQLFPNCITETKDENGNLKKAVNFELLQQMLSDEIADKDEIQLAVFCEKIFTTSWIHETKAKLELKGLNFDEVWVNIIKQIEGGEWDSNLSLSENIELKERKEKLQKEIDKLEKLARKEIQPKKKFELVNKKRKLEEELNNL